MVGKTERTLTEEKIRTKPEWPGSGKSPVGKFLVTYPDS